MWMQKIPDGAYVVVVNNYAKRESVDVGFVVEMESGARSRTSRTTRRYATGPMSTSPRCT